MLAVRRSTSEPISAYSTMVRGSGNSYITLTFFLRQSRQAVIVIFPFRTTRCGELRESCSAIMPGV